MDYTYDAIGNLLKKGNLVYAYGGKSFYGMITASPSPSPSASPSPNPSGSLAPVIPGPHAVTAKITGTKWKYSISGWMGGFGSQRVTTGLGLGNVAVSEAAGDAIGSNSGELIGWFFKY
ncbi:MAG: hypothetical protein HQL22_01510 [Candidatus Omnitrophica bacterium]|nr:hypothetical protein [Candidatus Omnitrophota bacterium]